MLFSCRSQISQLGKYLPCWCAYLQMLKVAPKNEKCPSLCLSTELVETVVSQHCDHTARIRDHTSGAIRPGPPMFSPKWHQSGSPKQKPNPRAISPSGVSDDPQITDVVSTLVCDPCVKLSARISPSPDSACLPSVLWYSRQYVCHGAAPASARACEWLTTPGGARPQRPCPSVRGLNR